MAQDFVYGGFQSGKRSTEAIQPISSSYGLF
jgi:hypothetical protein